MAARQALSESKGDAGGPGRKALSSLVVVALAVLLWREPGLRVVKVRPMGACRVGQVVIWNGEMWACVQAIQWIGSDPAL